MLCCCLSYWAHCESQSREECLAGSLGNATSGSTAVTAWGSEFCHWEINGEELAEAELLFTYGLQAARALHVKTELAALIHAYSYALRLWSIITRCCHQSLHHSDSGNFPVFRLYHLSFPLLIFLLFFVSSVSPCAWSLNLNTVNFVTMLVICNKTEQQL